MVPESIPRRTAGPIPCSTLKRQRRRSGSALDALTVSIGHCVSGTYPRELCILRGYTLCPSHLYALGGASQCFQSARWHLSLSLSRRTHSTSPLTLRFVPSQSGERQRAVLAQKATLAVIALHAAEESELSPPLAATSETAAVAVTSPSELTLAGV
ncbi:hypothetical protein Y032_0058g2896 [Ancylostoma ceylanicum]|uniref:Uncharacterized protein n=1 Tax=Ancylostoma ceylanicum TaxID=53326 RepID=A0A016U456_9BILA|nr:hypothetical protein Y032_0058g2896 [Ancylostoma ceylanicum]